VRQVEDHRHVGLLEDLLPHSDGGNDRDAPDRVPIRCSWFEEPDRCLLLLSLQGMAPDLEIRDTESAVAKGPRQGLKAKIWCDIPAKNDAELKSAIRQEVLMVLVSELR
jgi:hypothetical protein